MVIMVLNHTVWFISLERCWQEFYGSCFPFFKRTFTFCVLSCSCNIYFVNNLWHLFYFLLVICLDCFYFLVKFCSIFIVWIAFYLFGQRRELRSELDRRILEGEDVQLFPCLKLLPFDANSPVFVDGLLVSSSC